MTQVTIAIQVPQVAEPEVWKLDQFSEKIECVEY